MSVAVWTLVALAGLAAAVGGMRLVSRCDRRLGRPGNVTLQHARTPQRVEEVKAAWGPRLPDAVAALRWDFLLIVGYTGMLVGLVGLTTPAVAALLGVRDGVVFWLAAAVALAAGLSDTAENVTSLRELAHPATTTTARLTVGFARAKWALLALAAAWLVLAAIPMAVVRW